MINRRTGMVCIALALLSACASPPSGQRTVAGGAFTHVESRANKSAENTDRKTVRDENGTVVVQMVPYRTGVSTMTVEQMARKAGCTPRGGAGLLTDEGPVEVYRVQCEEGRYFTAQCELRQCRPLRR